MTTIAVAAASGSPGVTTTAALLAAGSGRPALVVEASPSGGTLPGSCGLRWTPGLVTVAAGFPGPLSHAALAGHAQMTPLGVPVVVGAPSGAEAVACLARLADPLAGWRATKDSGEVLVVDCGLLSPGSSLWPVATGADQAVLVVRQWETAAGECAARVRHTNALASLLAAHGGRVAAVVVGERPYQSAEIAAALGFPVVAVLPWEPSVGEVLAQGWVGRRQRGGLRRAAEASAAAVLTLAELPSAGDEAEVVA